VYAADKPFDRDQYDARRLSALDHRVVMLARAALGDTIERFAPKGSSQLTIAAIAVSGLFCDLVGTLSAAPELVATVNEHLALAGWQLVTVAAPPSGC